MFAGKAAAFYRRFGGPTALSETDAVASIVVDSIEYGSQSLSDAEYELSVGLSITGCVRGAALEHRARDAAAVAALMASTALPRPPPLYLTYLYSPASDADAGSRELRDRFVASVRAWLREPGNFIELVFGVADARERRARGKRGGRMFDVVVRPRELLKWEIATEFAIEAIPGDASESREFARSVHMRHMATWCIIGGARATTSDCSSV